MGMAGLVDVLLAEKGIEKLTSNIALPLLFKRSDCATPFL
jgi:hypothetical protein